LFKIEIFILAKISSWSKGEPQKQFKKKKFLTSLPFERQFNADYKYINIYNEIKNKQIRLKKNL